jgi:hypothetical protein
MAIAEVVPLSTNRSAVKVTCELDEPEEMAPNTNSSAADAKVIPFSLKFTEISPVLARNLNPRAVSIAYTVVLAEETSTSIEPPPVAWKVWSKVLCC